MISPRLAALCALLLACKLAQPAERPRAPASTFFSHEKHSALDCADCHTEIPAATALGQAKLPSVTKCKECHDFETMNAADKLAHTPPVREPDVYVITFDHAAHLARLGAKDVTAACKTCHAESLLPEPGPPRKITPPMQVCTACHFHQQEVAEAKCQPCHVSLRRYPLRPIEALAGFSHTGDFIRTHGKLAMTSAATCAACHDQTQCATCHATATLPFRPEIRFPESVQSAFIHRADFIARHQIEAAADPASCLTCHGTRFCDSCHQIQNISPGASSGAPNNPHPPGWAFRGSADFHGTAAKQNLVACAACHDQPGAANICTSCHRSLGPGMAGVGGNPHPPDFHGNDRGAIRRNSMCLACHTNG